MKIHLDTDFGGDIDDICALALLLARPDVEITGITTSADEGGRRCGYVRYVLKLAGREDIPVAAGADVSLGYCRWRPTYYEESAYWPERIARSPNSLDEGLALLERSVGQGAAVIAIGPYTNLALFDQRHPGALAGVPLYLMGFFVRPTPDGFPQWDIDTDWNVQSNVAASARMLESCAPIVVPVEMTIQTSLRRTYLATLRDSGPVGALIAHQSEAFAVDEGYEDKIGKLYAGLPDDTINFLHDPLAVAAALGWDGLTTETLLLRPAINAEGYLRAAIAPDGKPTRVVTSVEGAAFGEWWADTLTGGLKSPSG